MFKKISKKEILEGQNITRWYGITFRCFNSENTICHPIPLNYIFRCLYHIYGWLKCPTVTKQEINNIKIYTKAYKDAYKDVERDVWALFYQQLKQHNQAIHLTDRPENQPIVK